MPARRLQIAPALLALWLGGGCGTGPTQPTSDAGPSAPTATWFDDAGPILRTHCTGCHSPGGIAPFSLMAADDARAHDGAILAAIDSGAMPPFSALDAPACTPRHNWRDDARLSATEKATLHAWLESEQVEGAERPLPAPPSSSLANVGATVTAGVPFVSSGDRDQFVCYLLDPKLATDRWLTGLQVRPGAPELVHHVTVAIVMPGNVPAALATVGSIGVPLASCAGAPGLAVHSWLPGNPALQLPTNVAMPMPAGALIAIQLHYHPAGVGGTDATSIDLQLSDETPRWRYDVLSVGNVVQAPDLLPGPDDPASGPAFLIPANKAGHVEALQTSVPVPTPEIHIVNFTPHMHFLGVHQAVVLTHGDGSTECLGNSTWNFDWQRTYTYDAPIGELPLLDPNNVVTVTCEWDNTFANPNLPRLLHDANLVAPYDVTYGMSTTNEMCNGNLGMVHPL